METEYYTYLIAGSLIGLGFGSMGKLMYGNIGWIFGMMIATSITLFFMSIYIKLDKLTNQNSTTNKEK